MKKEYIFGVFVLCLFVWTVVVDNAVMPKKENLRQEVGAYSRYRVKKWSRNGKLDLLKDQILVYAVVDNREQLYYIDYKPYFEATLKIDYKPYFEATLKTLPEGTPLQLRYAKALPKMWKKHTYDIRSSGVTVLGYSPAQLILMQREINKFSMIMGGIFAGLVVVGFLNKPRRK
jgi:hypothetical protein